MKGFKGRASSNIIGTKAVRSRSPNNLNFERSILRPRGGHASYPSHNDHQCRSSFSHLDLRIDLNLDSGALVFTLWERSEQCLSSVF